MVYGLFDFLGKAGSIILVPLYAKMLGPADYGMLELFTVTGALLLVACVMGFNSALIRYFVTEEDKDERNKIFQTAFFSVLIASIVITLLLYIGAARISSIIFGSVTYAIYWRILFLTTLSDATSTMLLALYRSQTRPGLYSGINFFKLFLTLCLNIVFVGILHMGIYGVLIGNLTGSAIGLFISFFYAIPLIRIRISRRYLILLAKFGLPLLVSGFGFFIINSVDRYFLKAYTRLGDLGAYALGYKVGMLMSLAVNAFVVAWPPLMFKIAGDPEAKKTFSTVLTYYLFIACGIMVVIGSFGNEIVKLISSPEYYAAGKIIIFVLASYLFQGVYYILSTGVTITDNTKVVPVIVGISAGLDIAANFLLIPPYGIMGAAVATVISYAFLPVGMYFASQHYYRIRFESRRLLKIVMFTTLILSVNIGFITSRGILPAIGKFAIVSSYPFLLLAIGFFTADEITRGKTVLRKIIRRIRP